MSQYHREHPDEPIRHDFLQGASGVKTSNTVKPSHRLAARDLIYRSIGPLHMSTADTEGLVASIAHWLAQGATVGLERTPDERKTWKLTIKDAKSA